MRLSGFLIGAAVVWAGKVSAQTSEAKHWAESHYQVQERHDDFAGTTLRTVQLGRFADSGQCRGAFVELTLARQDTLVMLAVKYTARDWLFIDQLSPMLVLADSLRLEFPIAATPVRRTGVSGVPASLAGHRITEIASYLPRRDALTTIANAQVARLRVSGSEGRGNCDMRMDARMQAIAALFVERELNR